MQLARRLQVFAAPINSANLLQSARQAVNYAREIRRFAAEQPDSKLWQTIAQSADIALLNLMIIEQHLRHLQSNK